MEESGSNGIECPGGSCPSGSKRSPESIDIRADGILERKDGDQIIQELSQSEEEAVLGESFLE